MTELTNNYKANEQKLQRENLHLREELQVDSEKDGLYYAKKNAEISHAIAEGTLNPKVYRGEHGYASYFAQTEDDLKLKKYSGTLRGPQKAPTFIRSTTRIDHNPERCKDYYEHGYCGYGDTCIFIHDRSDYKSGAQLEEEYQQALKKKQKKIQAGERDCSSDTESNYEVSEHAEAQYGNPDPVDGLPTTCVICEKAFKDPVVTLCKHYFCEPCALQNYLSDQKCFVCGSETKGNFTTASEIEAKLRRKGKEPIKESAEETEAAESMTKQQKKEKESRFAT
jgi:RING finger protein 113A